MAYNLYSYRFKKAMPLMEEDEWSEIIPLLMTSFEEFKALRKQHDYTMTEARKFRPLGVEALKRYYEITNVKLEHPDQLYFLRLSNYGALCPKCDKPFRTPRAKICAECGYALPKGQVAGFIDLEIISDKKI